MQRFISQLQVFILIFSIYLGVGAMDKPPEDKNIFCSYPINFKIAKWKRSNILFPMPIRDRKTKYDNNWSKGSFIGCIFKDILSMNFAQSNLTRAVFYKSLTKVSFAGANLCDAHFIETIFTNVVLVGAKMNDKTNFENAFYKEEEITEPTEPKDGLRRIMNIKKKVTKEWLLEQGVIFTEN